jgi:hypothetical protein
VENVPGSMYELRILRFEMQGMRGGGGYEGVKGKRNEERC